MCCVKYNKHCSKGTGRSTTESMENFHVHLMGIPEGKNVQEIIVLNVIVKDFLDLKKDTNPDAGSVMSPKKGKEK